MTHFGYPVSNQVGFHQDTTTPYARRQQALEEQAFYERFGNVSTPSSLWRRAVDALSAAIGEKPTFRPALRSS